MPPAEPANPNRWTIGADHGAAPPAGSVALVFAWTCSRCGVINTMAWNEGATVDALGVPLPSKAGS